MQLGDARSGKLAGNLTAFGRALRRAGVPVDSARIALAQQAAQLVGLDRRGEVSAALEAVLVSREQDLPVFRELFDAFFRDPEIAQKLLAQMLPTTEGKAEPSKQRPRVREALAPPRLPMAAPEAKRDELRIDAVMTASDVERLRHADFAALDAADYALVERLAREVALPVPQAASRRHLPDARGTRLHWTGSFRQASRTGGELLQLRRLARRQHPLPLLVLADVSGSMERYARLLLAFLHAATRGGRGRCDVFAFGTRLTDLTPAFRQADSDAMLAAASQAIADFGGGTRLGDSLTTLREKHARRLVGGRTVVLVISDGLDTGEPQRLARELRWLGLHSGRLLWLNPLLRYAAYQPLAQGAAVLHRHAHAMLAVHSLEHLHALAGSLAALLKMPAARRP